MAKSFVLNALRIFSLDEILKLSRFNNITGAIYKKAAGEELVSWGNAPEEAMHNHFSQQQPDNVLPFKKERFEPLPENRSMAASAHEEPSNLVSSEFILWQRELTKDSGTTVLKKEAVKGYSKANEMYVVKSPTNEGKDKIRFAATNGVLIDKKQA